MRHPSLHYLLFTILLLLCIHSSRAHESCCKHKLGGQEPQVSEFIADPNDTAPEEFEGQRRYLVDPNDFRPDDWDSEDDGEWEPNTILNPDYDWKPRQIPNPNYVPPATYWDKLLTEIKMSIPWLTLGVIVTGFTSMSISLPPFKNALDWWKNKSNRPSNGRMTSIGSTSLAAMLGLATPLCSCGALPVAAGFWNEGVPLGSVVSFLVASQSAGIDSAAITYGLLGPLAVFSRLAGAMILAIVAGECLPKVASLNSKQASSGKCSASKGNQIESTSSFKAFLEVLADTAYEVFPSVLLGLALSTYVVHFHPNFFNPGTLASRGATTGVFMRWLLLATAVPMQLCEHTTVTLAAAIQKSGGSPGLAFGFLLSAPAVNLPTQALLTQKVMEVEGKGSPNIGLRIAIAVSGTALILSYVVDFFNLDLLIQEEASSDVGSMSFPDVYSTLCPWLAGLLFLVGVGRAHFSTLYSKLIGSASSIDAHGTDGCCNPSKEVKVD
ncbi:unnamed protein product [Cylindrotheca closterium]|uniref:Uncharacterized protein n=1 Tax=Cylindrotheca closterium TaxID=2856 RepID=A0AAD2FJ64_9STRA|nr:unnamed protein product [Cylindrotheca closterium]